MILKSDITFENALELGSNRYERITFIYLHNLRYSVKFLRKRMGK